MKFSDSYLFIYSNTHCTNESKTETAGSTFKIKFVPKDLNQSAMQEDGRLVFLFKNIIK